MRAFPLEQYDQYFSLKVSLGTKLLMFYLTKAFWVSFVAVFSKTKVDEIVNMFYTNDITHIISLALTAPVLVVLFTMLRRSPDAGKLLRMIWSYGKLLLSISMVSNLVVSIWIITERRVIPATDIVQLVLAFYGCVYVLTSRRFSATFKSFPEPGN